MYRKFVPYTNRPPHIFLDNTYYFITVRTVDKICYFDDLFKKNILVNIFQNAEKRFNYTFQAWVILDNHYHIMVKTKIGKDLSRFMGMINTNSSRELNEYDSKKSRKIWWNYWDKCMRGRKDFWTHVNYIHHNPVKHEYVKEMTDYHFSSYNQYFKKFGQDFLISSFKDFSIVDFTDKADDF